MKIRIVALCLLIAAAVPLLPAEEPWLILAEGKRAFRSRDFGAALELFRSATERKNPYPEAEYWIGLVFMEEGEWKIAEQQFLKALDRREALEVPDDVYTIQYKLADIYRLSGQYKLMEDQYRQILSDRAAALARKDAVVSPAGATQASSSPAGSGKLIEFQRNALGRVLSSEGLDKALLLFRLNDPVTLTASTALGYFYYQSGRTTEAVAQYGLAIDTAFSVALAEVIRQKPEFEFTTTNNALDEIFANREASAYVGSVDLFRQLYYLGCSLYFDGKRAPARDIWRLVRDRSEAGAWGRKARSQLANPVREFMNY